MKTYRFTARIEAADGGGAYVLFPYDVAKEFGTRGRVPVRVTFDGVSYTGSLIKYGNPLHMIPVLKAIRERIGKSPGDAVEIELQRDDVERVLDLPEALAAVLRQHRLEQVFGKLSLTNRREYCRWITGTKRAETRSARLAKVADMIRSGVKTPR